MIYTGSYENYKYVPERCVSISGDKGKCANFNGKTYSKLAPKLSFWKIWHENIGIIPELENTKYYIHNYYNLVLKNLSPTQVLADLDNKILICYESSTKFCHRHIISCWLKLELNIIVPEIKILPDGSSIEFERPNYIKDLLLAETLKV